MGKGRAKRGRIKLRVREKTKVMKTVVGKKERWEGKVKGRLMPPGGEGRMEEAVEEAS